MFWKINIKTPLIFKTIFLYHYRLKYYKNYNMISNVIDYIIYINKIILIYDSILKCQLKAWWFKNIWVLFGNNINLGFLRKSFHMLMLILCFDKFVNGKGKGRGRVCWCSLSNFHFLNLCGIYTIRKPLPNS